MTNPAYTNTLFVKGAGGSELEVLNKDEKNWYEKNRKKYMSEYKFSNVADLQDLDRLLGLELLSYRYTSWLTRGFDYDNLEFLEKPVTDHKGKIDTEIRQIKKSMALDRRGRTESEAENTADYLTTLLRRAEEFGVHRDNQIAKAIDLWRDLETMVGIHMRGDEEERRELGAEILDIFNWIVETALPEFNAIDDAFRSNQRLWIRDVS